MVTAATAGGGVGVFGSAAAVWRLKTAALCSSLGVGDHGSIMAIAGALRAERREM